MRMLGPATTGRGDRLKRSSQRCSSTLREDRYTDLIVRIVAVAETQTFEKDLAAIPDGDVFVHAGDMTRRGSLDEMEVVATWIRSLLHQHKIIVAGNHDWCFVRARSHAEKLFADCHYLQDSAVSIDGIQFWGSPWRPEFNDWAFNLPQGAALAEKWALIAEGTDVLVTHGPPAGLATALRRSLEPKHKRQLES